MFRRQKPIEAKIVAPKPVVESAPVFSLECGMPGCHEPAAHDLQWTIGNAGTCHKFYCPKCWAARQARLKKTGG